MPLVMRANWPWSRGQARQPRHPWRPPARSRTVSPRALPPTGRLRSPYRREAGPDDPVTLIVTALAAGAASALQDDAKSAVSAALARLRALAGKRLSARPAGQVVLPSTAGPDVYGKPLEHELTQGRRRRRPRWPPQPGS